MSTAANPKAPQVHPDDAPQESTGAVTSDSLAAESIKAGGEFASNDNAAISSVKGSNSTLNTTDTSGASVLPAARDGAQREKNDAKGLGADEKGVTGALYPDADGQPNFSGTHSQEGYVGGASADSSTGTSTGTTSNLPSGATGDSFADGGAGLTSSSSGSGADPAVSSGTAASKAPGNATQTSSSASGSGSGSSSGNTTSGSSGNTGNTGGSSGSADKAPNYAATVSGALRPEGEDKPKGENLQEGDIPETKTFTGDVGGQNDPGRLATKDFTKVGPGNAASAGETGGAQGDSGPQITGGQYDVLESERA